MKEARTAGTRPQAKELVGPPEARRDGAFGGGEALPPLDFGPPASRAEKTHFCYDKPPVCGRLL